MLNTNNVGMLAAWRCLVHELDAFFQEDNEVKIGFDASNYTIKVYVDNPEKADALAKLLPDKKDFGTVQVIIDVIPSNKVRDKVVSAELSPEEVIKNAFKGNKAVENIVTTDFFDTSLFTFVVFRNCVVQYYVDDLSDLYGMESTLYEDMARDLFNTQGVFFCTAVPDATKLPKAKTVPTK